MPNSFINPCALYDLPCRLPSGLCIGKPYWAGRYFEKGDRHHADASPCAYLDYVNKRLSRQAVPHKPDGTLPKKREVQENALMEPQSPSALLAARRKGRA